MIVVDVETTGLDPQKHSIVSLGAVDFNDPSRNFYSECAPWVGAEIDPIALKINGFTKEELLDSRRKSLKMVMLEFLEWIQPCKNKVLVGENVFFDRDMLNTAFEKSAISFRFPSRIIDLHSLSCIYHLQQGKMFPTDNGKSILNTGGSACGNG